MSASSASRTLIVTCLSLLPRASQGEPAQVDGHRDLRGMARAVADVDCGRDAGTHGGRPQQRGEASQLERRRVDALREQRRLVESLTDVATHLFEKRFDRRRVGVRR